MVRTFLVAAATTVVNPPGATTYREDTYVERQVRTNPIATVATDAASGRARRPRHRVRRGRS